MIAFTNIGNHSYVTAIKSQAFAQNTAAGSFQNGGVDIGVHEYIARTLGTAAVARINAPTFDINAIGGGHANAHTSLVNQMGD